MDDGVEAKSTDNALDGSSGVGVGAGLGTVLGGRALSLDIGRGCELSTLIRGDWVP